MVMVFVELVCRDSIVASHNTMVHVVVCGEISWGKKEQLFMCISPQAV